MRVVYHPAVQRDVNRVLRRYDQISPRLGDAFWEELMMLRWIFARANAHLRFTSWTGTTLQFAQALSCSSLLVSDLDRSAYCGSVVARFLRRGSKDKGSQQASRGNAAPLGGFA